MRKITAVFLTFVVALCLSACSKNEADPSATDSNSNAEIPIENISIADISAMDFSFTERELSGEYTEINGSAICSGKNFEISGMGIKSASGGITIDTEGVYMLSGNIEGSIVINAAENEKVQLLFSNLSVSNPNGAAVVIQSGDKVFITLLDNTINSVSDGNGYSADEDAAIFSRSDLAINGKGTLNVAGNTKHGIVSKDDLVIASGNINVNAVNVGLNGKDCVKLGDCSLNIKAGSDGIRSDNSEDADRGFVYIKGAKADITAESDGIQAEKVIKIDGGSLNIKSGNENKNENDESGKGLKAVSDIIIGGGNFNINSSDDCIHSNNTINITGGDFALSSGDDGIHADTDLAIGGGNLVVSKSYEGIEASKIVISGGNIDVTASDDGINAAGGNDSSGMDKRPGQGQFSRSTGSIFISGGYIHINSQGDGIDSNGTISVSGGITLVSGPTNNGNGAFDYDSSATVTGGVLIAAGSSGMAQGFSQAENQGAIFVSFSALSGGTNIALVDENGNVVASFTPEKNYQSVAITAPGIKQGNSYNLISGGSVAGADSNGFAQSGSLSGGNNISTIKMDSLLYGKSSGMGGMPGGGPGGMQPGGRPEGMPDFGAPPGRR